MKKRKAEILEGAQGVKHSKFIANNTLLIEYEDGRRAVRLHNTDVHITRPDGSQELFSGGWRTPTTKARINAHLAGARLYQEKGSWIISNARARVLFAEGIRILADGTIEGGAPDTSAQDRAILRKIRAYVNGIPDQIPEPSNGDCWYCFMRTEGNQTLGEASGNAEHLALHIEDGYYPGSLIYQALFKAGYVSPGAIVAMNCRDSIIRAVYKYMKRALLPHLAR